MKTEKNLQRKKRLLEQVSLARLRGQGQNTKSTVFLHTVSEQLDMETLANYHLQYYQK